MSQACEDILNAMRLHYKTSREVALESTRALRMLASEDRDTRAKLAFSGGALVACFEHYHLSQDHALVNELVLSLTELMCDRVGRERTGEATVKCVLALFAHCSSEPSERNRTVGSGGSGGLCMRNVYTLVSYLARSSPQNQAALHPTMQPVLRAIGQGLDGRVAVPEVQAAVRALGSMCRNCDKNMALLADPVALHTLVSITSAAFLDNATRAVARQVLDPYLQTPP